MMPIISHNKSLYDILKVSKSSTPVDIKKSYRKLCLIHHPDKVNRKDNKFNEKEATENFQRIVFAYSTLSDPIRRKKYDETGEIVNDDIFNSDEDFLHNFQDFLKSSMGFNNINYEMIEQDKKKYQDSDEELADLKEAFQFYEGDFIKLFEVIPHLEFTETEESRIWNIVNDKNNRFDLHKWQKWDEYVKNRNAIKKKVIRRLQREAKQVEKLLEKKKLQGNNSANTTDLTRIKSELHLKNLIQAKNSAKFDSMIDHLEKKYGGANNKKNKKPAKNGRITKPPKNLQK